MLLQQKELLILLKIKNKKLVAMSNYVNKGYVRVIVTNMYSNEEQYYYNPEHTLK